MDMVISCSGLTKTFGPKAVLDGLHLDVERGAVHALLGDNGAGKSTTMRILAGLLKPDAGRATVLGEDAYASAGVLRHKVAFVPEKPRYYDWMTVADIGAFAAGFHLAGFAERFKKLRGRFDLDPKARLKGLSKGMYAKVGLALALASEPEVLLLDEPTSGLDLGTRREFLASMVELACEGRTILISSHAVAELERVVSHASFVVAGRVKLGGTLEALRSRLVRLRVRQSEPRIDTSGLGTILDTHASGREWEATVLDAHRGAVEDLAHRPGVLDVREEVPTLEQMYAAVVIEQEEIPTSRRGKVGVS